MKKVTFIALFLLAAIAGFAQTTTTIPPGTIGVFGGYLSQVYSGNNGCGFMWDSTGRWTQLSDTVYRDTVDAKALMLNWYDTTLKIVYVVAVRQTHFCNDLSQEDLFYKDIYTAGMKSFFPVESSRLIKVVWKAAYPEHPHVITPQGL
jgi:hypothetical protein